MRERGEKKGSRWCGGLMWAVVDQMDPLVAVFMTCAWTVMLIATEGCDSNNQ